MREEVLVEDEHERNGNIADCLCVRIQLQPPKVLGEPSLFPKKAFGLFSLFVVCFLREGAGGVGPGPRLFNTHGEGGPESAQKEKNWTAIMKG